MACDCGKPMKSGGKSKKSAQLMPGAGRSHVEAETAKAKAKVAKQTPKADKSKKK